MKEQPDYLKGQYIYETLDGLSESKRVAEVLSQLVVLYPEETPMEGFDSKGELYFRWWVIARNAGLINGGSV